MSCAAGTGAIHEGTIMLKRDDGMLQAALIGYQHQLDEINAKIAELRRRLGGRSAPASGAAPRNPQKKHRISAEGRARIAAAQRKRWAAAKKNS
jgi:hypothetical protein